MGDIGGGLYISRTYAEVRDIFVGGGGHFNDRWGTIVACGFLIFSILVLDFPMFILKFCRVKKSKQFGRNLRFLAF